MPHLNQQRFLRWKRWGTRHYHRLAWPPTWTSAHQDRGAKYPCDKQRGTWTAA